MSTPPPIDLVDVKLFEGAVAAFMISESSRKSALEMMERLAHGELRRLVVASTTSTAEHVERLKGEVRAGRAELKVAREHAGERLLYLTSWAAAFAKASGLAGVDDAMAAAHAEKVARAAVAEAKRRGVIK